MLRPVPRYALLSATFVGSFLVAVLPALAQEKTDAAQDFMAQVEAGFPAWDKDSDGTLSAEELNVAVADPKITGHAAAAVATLKRALRNKNYHLPPLTRQSIQERIGTKLGKDQPDFAGLYKSVLPRLPKTSGVLFTPGGPKLGSIRQGRVGDCFCLAPLAAMLARDPQEVTRLFETEGDGNYSVRLGKKAVIVAAPTDAEIVLTASTAQSGMWVNLYEKAVGTTRLKPEEVAAGAAGTSPLDAVARGGSAGTMLSVLTGNPITRFSCRFARSSETTDKERTTQMLDLRKRLTAAVTERRLITCGTTKTTTPGITPNHAYAVLGYDETTDTIQLWNPHGDSFQPKGTEGLANGYPRSEGVFCMPLADFVNQFSGVAFEEKTNTGLETGS